MSMQCFLKCSLNTKQEKLKHLLSCFDLRWGSAFFKYVWNSKKVWYIQIRTLYWNFPVFNYDASPYCSFLEVIPQGLFKLLLKVLLKVLPEVLQEVPLKVLLRLWGGASEAPPSGIGDCSKTHLYIDLKVLDFSYMSKNQNFEEKKRFFYPTPPRRGVLKNENFISPRQKLGSLWNLKLMFIR